MIVFLFLIAMIGQLASGFPIVPLLMFWQIIKPAFATRQAVAGEFINALFWGTVSGASLAIMSGHLIYWILLMNTGAVTVVFIRRYIFLALTPVTISLLLLIMVGVWMIFSRPFSLPDGVTLYFFYLLFFFIIYALADPQKNHQRRLF